MALVIADRVRETTASIGTGTLTLGGPYSGFQAFSVLGNGNTTYYAVIDPTTGNWEVGIGTYTLSGNTLSRDTVLSSSNSDSLVPFGAGVKDVICTQPAERAVYLDTATSATIPNIVTAQLTATADSAFTSTGALTISKGTTGQQPGTPVTGMLRYNTTTGEFEGYSGSSPSWKSVGGSAISNDTSTATDLFPLFAAATTGTAQNIFTSNAQYLFKPSTGELSVKAPRASNGIVVNSATVTSNYTIAAGDNGMSTGPVTVNSGITVTVSSGSVWTVI